MSAVSSGVVISTFKEVVRCRHSGKLDAWVYIVVVCISMNMNSLIHYTYIHEHDHDIYVSIYVPTYIEFLDSII